MKKIVLSLIMFMLIITGCGKKKVVNNNEETIKENTNPEVISDKVVDGIELKFVSLTYENGLSTLITRVINNTDSDYELDEYIVIARDIHGVEIRRFPAYVGNTIKAGEIVLLNSSIDIDLSEAGSIEYEVKKLES